MSKARDNRRQSGIRRGLRAWLTQHAQAFVFSLGQLYKYPLGTFLTAAVIGISLALPAGFYLLLENMRQISDGWEYSSDISLFLRHDHPDHQVGTLVDQIRAMDGVMQVTIIDRDQALAEYRALSGFDQAVDLLVDNPLPNVLLIKPQPGELGSASIQVLLEQLRQLPQVDAAQFDRQWVQRLFLIMQIIQRTIIVLSVILGIAVLLIVGNTIRLAIYNRRQEIEINKLFGATNAFIQRPFLYYGLLQGIIGGLIACVLLQIAAQGLHGPVSRLSLLYNDPFQLSTLGLFDGLAVTLSGGLLGIVGAFLSVRRHIKAFDPV
ncbi:MAG: permease-like cell division protein FtsX [Gammaproteobacteria bacterium]